MSSGLHLHLPPLTVDVLRLFREWWDDRITKQDISALRTEIMHTLQEILDQARANTTLVESLNTLLDGVRQQVTDVLSGTVIPPPVQARLDEVFDELTRQRGVIADTMTENTPNATPPGP